MARQADSFSLLQVPRSISVRWRSSRASPRRCRRIGAWRRHQSRLAASAGGRGELLVNATSQSGRDVTTWLANPIGNAASWTLLGGFHRQSEQDLDDDGWPTFRVLSALSCARVLHRQWRRQDDVRHDRPHGRGPQRRHVAKANVTQRRRFH